jgi:hypothetical protein
MPEIGLLDFQLAEYIDAAIMISVCAIAACSAIYIAVRLKSEG